MKYTPSRKTMQHLNRDRLNERVRRVSCGRKLRPNESPTPIATCGTKRLPGILYDLATRSGDFRFSGIAFTTEWIQSDSCRVVSPKRPRYGRQKLGRRSLVAPPAEGLVH